MNESFGKNVNRFYKVPAINDNGFKLAESVAIFHYLGRKGNIPERWYPKDLRSLAKIDEYLEWHHTNLLDGAGRLFYMQWVAPALTGQKPSKIEIEKQEAKLNKNLKDIETLWLNESRFLGGDKITYPDLLAASALEQVIGLKLFQIDEQQYPRTNIWIQEVRDFFGLEFKEGHKFVYSYGNKYGGKLL